MSIEIPHIIICSPEETEYNAWLTDLHKVKDAGPELKKALTDLVHDFEILGIWTIKLENAKRLLKKLPNI